MNHRWLFRKVVQHYPTVPSKVVQLKFPAILCKPCNTPQWSNLNALHATRFEMHFSCPCTNLKLVETISSEQWTNTSYLNKHLLLKWCAWPARLQLNTEYEPESKWQIKVDLKTGNLVLGWVPTAAKADGRRSQLTEKHVALYSDQNFAQKQSTSTGEKERLHDSTSLREGSLTLQYVKLH